MWVVWMSRASMAMAFRPSIRACIAVELRASASRAVSPSATTPVETWATSGVALTAPVADTLTVRSKPRPAAAVWALAVSVIGITPRVSQTAAAMVRARALVQQCGMADPAMVGPAVIGLLRRGRRRLEQA